MEKTLKTDNVQIAVWLAAAVIAYNETHKEDGDVFARQVDIQRLASNYCTNPVASARVGQWFNGDHSNNTYNYLRSKGSLRRLTKFGEFEGVRELPDELNNIFDENILLDSGKIMTIGNLFCWVRDVYSTNKVKNVEVVKSLVIDPIQDKEVQEKYLDRINLIIKQSWEILISQFTGGRLILSKEAPFQHHFASIIKSVGNLHCYKRSEQFHVDLETKDISKNGKNTYIDIVVEYYDEGDCVLRSAIELKFKKKSQGADDFAHIDSYIDIENLEYLKMRRDKGMRRYHHNYFFMITNNKSFLKQSRSETTGAIFPMYDGCVTPNGVTFTNPNCKGRRDVSVHLNNQYAFKWMHSNDWYFLKMDI